MREDPVDSTCAMTRHGRMAGIVKDIAWEILYRALFCRDRKMVDTEKHLTSVSR